MAGDKACCSKGPGYRSPLDATKGPKEQILYVACIQPNAKVTGKPDYVATIDVNPNSKTYCKVIHRTEMAYAGDELHWLGWNTCSSCFGDPTKQRNRLIVPGLTSSRIYIVDVGSDPKAPKLFKVIEPKQLEKLDATWPHSLHCLPSGEVMISTIGDNKGNAKGSFILLDGKTFDVKSEWSTGNYAPFGYAFWYQPRHNVMISTAFGVPNAAKNGFDEKDVADGQYGHQLYVWNWTNKKLLQTIDLGEEGMVTREVQFLHDPEASEGYVMCSLSGTVFRIFKSGDKWAAEKVIAIPDKKVENWKMANLPAFLASILISMDDKYLYCTNWLHGDIRQYDITDTRHPKLVGQIFTGGSICTDGNVKVIEDPELQKQPQPRIIKGKRVEGGPQKIQLSLDGKRLYVTTSLHSVWDKQFYPEMHKKGSVMMQIDVNTESGGLSLNENFLVDFGEEPNGPVLAHDIRYPGGDCNSDIWL